MSYCRLKKKQKKTKIFDYHTKQNVYKEQQKEREISEFFNLLR